MEPADTLQHLLEHLPRRYSWDSIQPSIMAARLTKLAALAGVTALIAAACSSSGEAEPTSPLVAPQSTEALARAIYEESGTDWFYRQVDARDTILPIYDPEFDPADESPLPVDQIVLGVAIKGEAKAYPIRTLRYREMVNDDLGGVPILVTW